MNKNLAWAYVCLALIATITLASGSNIGFSVEGKPITSIDKKTVFSGVQDRYDAPIRPPRAEVYTLTVSNKFIPRSYPLPEFQGCLYDSESGRSQYASINADVVESRNDFSRFGSVEVGVGKTEQVKYFLESAPKFPEQKEVNFDYLLLLDNDIECRNILLSEIDPAMQIPII
jgi:hypothetical protein